MSDTPPTTEEKRWTKEDIGKEVEVLIEGVHYHDIIVEVWLPDGQKIIGPRLKCGHIFARYTMVPAMMQASEETEKAFEMMGGE